MQPFPTRTFDHTTKWAELGRIKTHRSRINVVALSPDGKYLASGDQDGYVLISRTSKLKQTFTLRTSGGGIRNLKWYPTGESAFIVASANGDINKVSFARSDSGSNVTFSDTLMGNVPGVINAFDLNTDGSQVAIGFGGTVMILTMGLFENTGPPSFSTVRSKGTRVVREVIYISNEVIAISYLIDEEDVLIAYSTDITHKFLWKIKKPLNRPFSHRTGGCAVSPSRTAVAIMNLNGAVDFYYIPTRKLLLSKTFGQRSLYASDLKFITDDCVITGGGDGRLTFIPMHSEKRATFVTFDDLGPLFQTLTFAWREGEILIASASTTESGNQPQVIVAKKRYPDDNATFHTAVQHTSFAHRDRGPDPALPASVPAGSDLAPNSFLTPMAAPNTIELVIGSVSILVVVMGVGFYYTSTDETWPWHKLVRQLRQQDHEGFWEFPHLGGIVAPLTSTASTITTATATATVILTQLLHATDAPNKGVRNDEGNNLLPILYALGFSSIGAIISAVFFVPSHRTRLVAWYSSANIAFKVALGGKSVESAPADASLVVAASAADAAGTEDAPSSVETKEQDNLAPAPREHVTEGETASARPVVDGECVGVSPIDGESWVGGDARELGITGARENQVDDRAGGNEEDDETVTY